MTADTTAPLTHADLAADPLGSALIDPDATAARLRTVALCFFVEVRTLRAELARWRAEPSEAEVGTVAQAIWDTYGVNVEHTWAEAKELAKTSHGWQDFIDDTHRQARAAIKAWQEVNRG